MKNNAIDLWALSKVTMLFSQNPKEMTEQQRNSILILRSKVPCFDKFRRTLEGPYSRY